MEEALSGMKSLELSSDELMLVRLSSALAAEEESPLPVLETKPSADRLEAGARSLVSRGLADSRTYRPDREILRRVLAVAQPDARVVMLAVGSGQAERQLDVYERAQVFVSYGRHGDRYRFGPPLEFVDLYDEISTHLVPRRSTGDFIRLDLDPAEHFVFSTAARTMALGLHRGGSARLERHPPITQLNDLSLDGAVLIPGKPGRFVPGGADPAGQMPMPSEGQWLAALERLVAMGVLHGLEGGFELRPFLHDLAVGLVQHVRYVVTRFDFGEGEWLVRDGIFVPVPGSLFLLRPTAEQGLAIRELDAEGLSRALRAAISVPALGDSNG